MRAWVELQPSLDVRRWPLRHACGQVADRMPYGLDRLGAHGVRATARHDPTSPLRDGVLRGVRWAGGGYLWTEAATRRPPPGTDVALSWDERRGAPRALLDGRRTAVATGVIWLTEELAAGPARPGARAAVSALRRCALVWVLAEPQRAVLQAAGVPAGRLARLPFGVDADFWAPAPPGGVDPDLLLAVGNDRSRDWDTLLTAFAALRARRPSVRLEIASRMPPPRVPDGVVVRGQLPHPQLRGRYARAAAVVVTTAPNLHVSGMTVALEAQACARPLVMTRTAGVEDYVGDGGRLVPPGDPAALARTLLDVLDDPAGAAELGRAGRAAVERSGSSAHTAAALAALLRRC